MYEWIVKYDVKNVLCSTPIFFFLNITYLYVLYTVYVYLIKTFELMI